MKFQGLHAKIFWTRKICQFVSSMSMTLGNSVFFKHHLFQVLDIQYCQHFGQHWENWATSTVFGAPPPGLRHSILPAFCPLLTSLDISLDFQIELIEFRKNMQDYSCFLVFICFRQFHKKIEKCNCGSSGRKKKM